MCLVEDCNNHDTAEGCMVRYNNEQLGPLACKYGQFVTDIIERFGHLGSWKFRGIGNTSDALVATLRCKHGRVEIWGGLIHRDEVWAIQKGTDGCLISTRVTKDAVEMACGRVGMQRRLAL